MFLDLSTYRNNILRAINKLLTLSYTVNSKYKESHKIFISDLFLFLITEYIINEYFQY